MLLDDLLYLLVIIVILLAFIFCLVRFWAKQNTLLITLISQLASKIKKKAK